LATGQISPSQTACVEGETEWHPLSQLLKIAAPTPVKQSPQVKPNLSFSKVNYKAGIQNTNNKDNNFVARPTVTANTFNEYEIKRRSSWSTAFIVSGCVGCLLIVLSIFSFIASKNDNQFSQGLSLMIAGAVGSLHGYFFSFLINVFTDIRWFLKKISEKQ